MSIPYFPIRRTNPQDKSESKYYPCVQSFGDIVEVNNIAEEMANASSLTKGDIKNCIDGFVHSILHYVLLGHKVRIGELGIFKAGLVTKEGADTKEEATPEKVIAKAKLVFVPSAEVKRQLDGAQFEKYDDKLKK